MRAEKETRARDETQSSLLVAPLFTSELDTSGAGNDIAGDDGVRGSAITAFLVYPLSATMGDDISLHHTDVSGIHLEY